MGFNSLTPGQKQVIREIAFKRRDAYLGLPTNWGKSIVALVTSLLSQMGYFDHYLIDGQDVIPTLLIVPSQVYSLLYLILFAS
jgi:superfamily II DNA helicase RecQ